MSETCTVLHHKHQGLDPLIRSVSRVTTVLANVSSVFQLFFFLVVCSDMIWKGFGLVAFFANVKASSVSIHLYCLVCIQSVVHGVRSRLFCGHKGCSLPEVSITSFLCQKKVQLDATVCRHLFTAQSLYMFRVSQHPSSGVLKTVSATSGIGLHTVASSWTFLLTLNHDARNHEFKIHWCQTGKRFIQLQEHQKETV